MTEAAKWPGIAAWIAAAIRTGRWPVGARLPRSGDLARELGVAEGTARKAIDRLAGIGVLRVRRRVGVFVAAIPPDPLPDLDVDADPFDGLRTEVAELRERVARLEEWRDAQKPGE